jgi:hypothetical protein
MKPVQEAEHNLGSKQRFTAYEINKRDFHRPGLKEDTRILIYC